MPATGCAPNPMARWLDRLQPSRAPVMFTLSFLVGLGTGLGAVFFIRLIEWVGHVLYGVLPGVLPDLGRGWYIVGPILGALVAGPIIAYVAHEAKGHGVPEVMEAIALRGGRIRPVVVVAKVGASAACIGSGGSAGREGPIVQVGAALGSTIGQWLRFSESRIRNLVACGAAAGIAATFNAPIAGVLFALEIILGELSLEDLASVIFSAVTAATVSWAFLGERPAFSVPSYGLAGPWEIIAYFGLGLIAALVGVAFIKTLYAVEDLFDNWRFPDALKPAVGAVIMGVVGFGYPYLLRGTVPVEQLSLNARDLLAGMPQIYGSGYPSIQAALLGKVSVWLLLTLLVLKLVATILTLGSGNSGGVFAPSLFMGAMTGGAFGWLLHSLFPQWISGPGAYATVGMAAVFAAAARAPLTAVMIVFEMTDDYRILLPLLAAVVVSMVLAEHLHHESIYTLKLARRGIHLFRGRDVDIMSTVRVEEVMDRKPVTVSPDLPVQALPGLFLQTNSHGFPVVDEKGELWGIVSITDYRDALRPDGSIPPDLKVRDIATRDVVVAYPDEPVRAVLQRMAPRDLSRVPVVARDNPRKLLGLVRRNEIVRAYELGMVRRGFALGHLPGMPKGTAEAQFPIPPGASIVGKTLAELHIPEAFLIIHIHRDGESIVPHGGTVLQAGDVVTLLARDGDVEALNRFWRQLISAPPPQAERQAEEKPAEG